MASSPSWKYSKFKFQLQIFPDPEEQDRFLRELFNELSTVKEMSQESSKERNSQKIKSYFETNSTSDQQKNDREFFDQLFLKLKTKKAKQNELSEDILPEEADDETNIKNYEIFYTMIEQIQSMEQLNSNLN